MVVRPFPQVPLRIGAGLALIAAGAVLFALAGPDSWAALAGLAANLGGLALLFVALPAAMLRAFGPPAPSSRPVQQGCTIAILRVLLITALVGTVCVWIWFAALDLNEVRLLTFAPRYQTAQVVGHEPIAGDGRFEYLNYSYRASPTVAPVDHLVARRGDARTYRIGQRFEVTYAASAPRVHRIGRLDWQFSARRILFWPLLLADAAGYILLPLWLLECRRRPGPRGHALANPALGSK